LDLLPSPFLICSLFSFQGRWPDPTPPFFFRSQRFLLLSQSSFLLIRFFSLSILERIPCGFPPPTRVGPVRGPFLLSPPLPPSASGPLSFLRPNSPSVCFFLGAHATKLDPGFFLYPPLPSRVPKSSLPLKPLPLPPHFVSRGCSFHHLSSILLFRHLSSLSPVKLNVRSYCRSFRPVDLYSPFSPPPSPKEVAFLPKSCFPTVVFICPP